MRVKILSPTYGQRVLTITPLPLVVAVLGLLALLAPFGQAEQPWQRVGVLLAAGGGLQVLHGVRRAESAALRRAVSGGVLSILMGLLVLAGPDATALVLILAMMFALDGVRYLGAARRTTGRLRRLAWIGASADLATAVALLVVREATGTWLVAVAAALRLFALFDYNVAPFFQSFVEVRVEASADRVRLWPYGVHGRLRWRDLSRSVALSATTGNADDFAEWIVPMR